MRVFLTGATGYIGGSLAARLVRDGHEVVGLTRSERGAEALRERGVAPVLGTLDDRAVLAREAAAADAVINAADSDHRVAAEALVDALAGSGKPLLHTSGSSIVGDDARGELSEHVYTEEDIRPDGPWRPTPDKAPRVAIDRLVLDAGTRGVRSVVLCNSLIYGHGRGIARDSVQIPRLVAQARASGVARHIGPGRNIWSTVHIDDVVDLYLLALADAPAGAFYFVENGEASFAEMTRAIAEALGLGPAEPWDIDSAIAEWGYEPAVYALGSNSRVRGVRAREELGWTPRHGSVTDWIRHELTAE
ncbi:Nucleoside-diphosphate-sugar epimerase [Streptoalloteichus tenebrarius]|uniref:Nucleoside-diphosphate-sugar epimerase n=1 Tax=Streptoalloteichus tenebrarius (strain ATCC 17920 / DSM 40477 / JCM 4838 / CBS 697.72 / NBRC 16177 / NCIMB 11028 / NRRL B-12390 / A12253. 1 / ISP 5477) TaxID=1933 RepID=A0ABT1HM45_STRSD|nr:NAD-dependent epimerase/dehydratase family protein [Streptoalloteichus tenebrarius]MCP2256592.1 Nucleoside-diphosphate-sugar epimerase [Streptoalloteichus tenebrarius]BFF04945.1 NAD-dependent epimerase/dehydratase family protein [Streptoalloteichus tenebrarius]